MITSREDILDRLRVAYSGIGCDGECDDSGIPPIPVMEAEEALSELISFFAPSPPGVAGGKHVNLVFKHIIDNTPKCKVD